MTVDSVDSVCCGCSYTYQDSPRRPGTFRAPASRHPTCMLPECTLGTRTRGHEPARYGVSTVTRLMPIELPKKLSQSGCMQAISGNTFRHSVESDVNMFMHAARRSAN